MNLRAVSFQIHRLPPEFRVLALCIIAFASLISFHEYVLGEGPHPETFADISFFSVNPDLPECGARRVSAYRALRAEAFKAAWDAGTMLQPSTENAASCYLLDLLEQSIHTPESLHSVLNVYTVDASGASRPWASAYMSHVRVLAPTLRGDNFSPPDAGHWAAFFVRDSRFEFSRLIAYR